MDLVLVYGCMIRPLLKVQMKAAEKLKNTALNIQRLDTAKNLVVENKKLQVFYNTVDFVICYQNDYHTSD